MNYFTGYISPQNLQKSEEQESVVFYTMTELEQGECSANGKVMKRMPISKKVKRTDTNQAAIVIEEITTEDRVSDVLIGGVERHFLKAKGMNCSFDWMLQEPKEKLLAILDDSDVDRQTLARLLKQKERSADKNSSSTVSLIQQWCDKSGKQMSLRSLYTILKHPGLVGNRRAAGVIEEMLQNVGHKVNIIKY